MYILVHLIFITANISGINLICPITLNIKKEMKEQFHMIYHTMNIKNLFF